jgi:hypothetical protein
MKNGIFCQENFCNDKRRECPVKVKLGEGDFFNSDEPTHLNDNRLLKNKRVINIFFLIFHIYQFINIEPKKMQILL